MEERIIALASDHAGFDKKEVTRKYFESKRISYKDFGCFSAESVDYPDFAHLIGRAIENGEYKIGFTFCGSGQGISIAVNKHQHVRSAVCWCEAIARLARQHNDANICSIPGRFVTDEETIAIVEAFLSAGFEGGRHLRRVQKIPLF